VYLFSVGAESNPPLSYEPKQPKDRSEITNSNIVA